MKRKIVLFALLGFLIFVCIYKTRWNSPNIDSYDYQLESRSTATDEQLFKKITDKNIDLANSKKSLCIVSEKNIDDFWKDCLPDIEIRNEWIYPGIDDCSVAIFGALKDTPQQGAVEVIAVNSNYEIKSIKQLTSPNEGGALSVIDEPAAKDFVMDVQDEMGRIYLFDFFNGFIAYKDNKNDDWRYLE